MGFLFKAAFWLSLVILLLPAGDFASGEAEDVSAGEALTAAQIFIADMSGFCSRNPAACETGSAALVNFTAKAQNGAKMLYGYLGHLNNNDTPLESRGVATYRVPVPANDNDLPEDAGSAYPPAPAYSDNGLASGYVPSGPAPSAVATHTGSIRALIAESMLGISRD